MFQVVLLTFMTAVMMILNVVILRPVELLLFKNIHFIYH